MAKPDHVVWHDVLSYLRGHHPDMCRQWFEEIDPVGIEGGVYLARVDQSVRQRYLHRQCTPQFTDALQAVTGRLVSIRFLGPDDAPPGVTHNGSREESASSTTHAAHRSTGYRPGALVISPDYTFENFIVGPENRLAHAAALSICANPARTYNPLFVHGGVGLGKTHLLQAVCLRLLARTPPPVIYYVSCEEFGTQFMDAVQAGQMSEFRHRFRDVDVLLIDDIHFLTKRERTQEEFFHTFNALFQSDKQIILSSDAAPNEIPDLEERLVSRFQSGLVVQMQPPCYDTRIQIVKQKAKIRGMEFGDEVAAYIAAKVTSNIRELEGAVVRVHMQHVADGLPIDLGLARTALETGPATVRPEVTIANIIDAVVSYYGVKLTDLQSKRRQKSIAHPRQVCMYLARQHTRFSLEEIGGYFGGRDHTTVMHAVKTIIKRRNADGDFGRVLEALEDRVRAPSPMTNGTPPTRPPTASAM
ncbi:MAG: chromosomal replication initiator protein DnaA [Phycisphaerae bacterium]|nr:chromosomal replication initiator protein DnaA [Phycisphaerae bacterium]